MTTRHALPALLRLPDDLVSEQDLAAAGCAGTTSDRAPPATGKARLPYNNHDSNAITFHRVRHFRSLALDLRTAEPTP